MVDSNREATLTSLGAILGAKWSLHVIATLESRSCGFNELKRSIDGVEAATLSRRLKELQCHGLVERQVDNSTPPRTTYSVTTAGSGFAKQIADLAALTELNHRDHSSKPETADCRCAPGTETDTCLTVSSQ